MFYAKDQFEQIIHISNKSVIKQLHTITYFCPDCNGVLLVKSGGKKVAHFAHKKKALCDNFSKGETNVHIKGKQLLYEYLKKSKSKVKIEKYFPEISQRADLFIENHKKGIVIEFQCSVVPIHLIYSRTEGYKKVQIPTIWILSKKLLVSKTPHLFTLTDFTLYFCSFPNTFFPTIIFFDTFEECFYTLVIIAPFSSKNVMGVIKKSTNIQRIKQINHSAYECEEYSKIWYKKNIQSRIWLHRKLSKWRNLRDKIYQLNIFPSLYPVEVFLPVSTSIALISSIDIWQLHIYIFLLKDIKLGGIITIKKISAYVDNNRRLYQKREFLNGSIEVIDIIILYMDSLVRLQNFRKVKNGYQLQKEFTIPKTVEEGALLCSLACKILVREFQYNK